MSTKKEILKILEENRGEIFSGQTIADNLNISRNSVWKAIKSLQSEGFEIFSKGKMGYFLLPTSNKLTKEGITANLSDNLKTLPLFVFDTIDSTNEEAKRLLSSEFSAPFLVVSNEQTRGKGRLGRNFFSPADSGIYMSIAFNPQIPIAKSSLTTTSAAVAVCRAIESIFPCEAKIKWVNDVFCLGKKVGGILTEGISNIETGELETIVVGIGINCFSPRGGFPTEISDIASSISKKEQVNFNRNLLAAKITNNFFDIWNDINSSKFMNEYKNRSLVLGNEITVVKNPTDQDMQIVKSAYAIDINDDGSLVVEYEDKSRETLIAGEVSLKL